MKRTKFRHMGGGGELSSSLTPQRIVSGLFSGLFLRSCGEE